MAPSRPVVAAEAQASVAFVEGSFGSVTSGSVTSPCRSISLPPGMRRSGRDQDTIRNFPLSFHFQENLAPTPCRVHVFIMIRAMLNIKFQN